MKEDVKIITIIDNNNYGNRLQNYALEKYIIKNFKLNIETLNNNTSSNTKKWYFLRKLKNMFAKKKAIDERSKNFFDFNKNINLSNRVYTVWNRFDCYGIVGSDQVWNPTIGRLRDFDLLSGFNEGKKVSYAASFGIENIKPNEKIKKSLNSFKAISVREYSGKKIVEDLTGRKNVKVLIDPTMLLTQEEWDKVSKRPKMLKNENYILNYFLGDLSNSRKEEIEKVAKDNNCEVINILDKKSPFYTCGPSEFLYLEKNAFLICTDSFHASVFAILFDRPFIVFDREQKGVENMNSRIDTLIKKFRLENRMYNNNQITQKNLEHDYTEAYKILEEERRKSDDFLREALEVEDKR